MVELRFGQVRQFDSDLLDSTSIAGGGFGDPLRRLVADGIDVATMQQNNSTLTVGSVTFGSNDDRSGMIYKIRLSPAENPPSGIFAFYRTGGGGNAIPYKVYAPSRPSPSATAFTIQAPAKGPAEFWQDFFEVAIAHMNYDDVSIFAGDYTSGIKIELIVE